MSDATQPKRRRRAEALAHSPHRLEALTDGVFAIAMTILVLELKIPEGHGDRSLAEAIQDIAPVFRSYVLSFIILGVYWLGQRSQYDYIVTVDRVLTWINIFFLAFISAIPFSASLIGRFRDDPLALVIYGANLVICSGLHAAVWWYATRRKHRMVSEDCTDEVVKVGRWLSLVPVVFYAVAMFSSIVSTELAHWLYFVVPVLFVFNIAARLRPGRLDAAEEGFEEGV